jgi:uncharacterized repeat protein (TIGR02543 family)
MAKKCFILLALALCVTACEYFNRPLGPWIDEQYELMRKVWDVSVSPQSISAAPGNTRQFSVRVNARADTDRRVMWSVSGASDSGTRIDGNGLLTVGSGESLGAALTVTAASVFDPGKRSSARVTIRHPIVTFDPAGGTIDGSPESASAVAAPSLNFVNAPSPAHSNSGFVFAGWYTDKSGGSPVIFPYTPTADSTLYARWKYNAAITGGASWAAAINALNSAPSGSYVIDIGSNSFSVGNSGSGDNPGIGSGANLTVTGSGTVTLTGQGNLLKIDGNTAVTLDGPTLRGPSGTNNAALVCVAGGSFTLQTGNIQGNTSNGSDWGGGVNVGSGAFTMTGGTISGNSATGGGGVYFYSGSFTMSGGTISGNTATGSGGGVCISNQNGNFIMTGGTITQNSAGTWGGGVMVNSGSVFTISGGSVTDNQAGSNGGGVGAVNGGRITINTPAGVANFTGNTPNHVYNNNPYIDGTAGITAGW